MRAKKKMGKERARVSKNTSVSDFSVNELVDMGMRRQVAVPFKRVTQVVMKRQFGRQYRAASRDFLVQYSLATFNEKALIADLLVAFEPVRLLAANGCGPGSADWLIPDFCFEECCAIHDACYDHGGNESDRKKCDDSFLECMEEAGPDWLAEIYYRAVRRFGKSRFNYR